MIGLLAGNPYSSADNRGQILFHSYSKARAKAMLKKLSGKGSGSLVLKTRRKRRRYYKIKFLTSKKIRHRDLSALRRFAVVRVTSTDGANVVVVNKITSRRDGRKVVQRALRLGWKRIFTKRMRGKLTIYSVERQKSSPQTLVFNTTAPMPKSLESTDEGHGIGETDWIDATLIVRGEGVAPRAEWQRPPAKGTLWLDLTKSWSLTSKIDLRLGGHWDAYSTEGTSEVGNFTDLAGTSLQARWKTSTLTLGVEKVQWGRLEENSILARLGRTDFRRGPAQGYEFMKRGDPLARYQKFMGKWSFDLLAIAQTKPMLFSPEGHLWSIVDNQEGRLLGTVSDPILSQLLQLGSFADRSIDDPSGGLMLGRMGDKFDFGLYVVHAPRPIPMLIPNPEVLTRIGMGQSPQLAIASTSGATFVQQSPFSTMVVIDGATERWGNIWMFEMGLDPSYSVLNSNFQVVKGSRYSWRLGLEMNDLSWLGQLALRASGDKLVFNQPVAELKEFYDLSLKWWKRFAAEKWELSLRSMVAVGRSNIYLNPQLQYLGWEPHSISLGYHFFEGAEREVGGYYSNKDVVSLSLRGSF